MNDNIDVVLTKSYISEDDRYCVFEMNFDFNTLPESDDVAVQNRYLYNASICHQINTYVDFHIRGLDHARIIPLNYKKALTGFFLEKFVNFYSIDDIGENIEKLVKQFLLRTYERDNGSDVQVGRVFKSYYKLSDIFNSDNQEKANEILRKVTYLGEKNGKDALLKQFMDLEAFTYFCSNITGAFRHNPTQDEIVGCMKTYKRCMDVAQELGDDYAEGAKILRNKILALGIKKNDLSELCTRSDEEFDTEARKLINRTLLVDYHHMTLDDLDRVNGYTLKVYAADSDMFRRWTGSDARNYPAKDVTALLNDYKIFKKSFNARDVGWFKRLFNPSLKEELKQLKIIKKFLVTKVRIPENTLHNFVDNDEVLTIDKFIERANANQWLYKRATENNNNNNASGGQVREEKKPIQENLIEENQGPEKQVQAIEVDPTKVEVNKNESSQLIQDEEKNELIEEIDTGIKK